MKTAPNAQRASAFKRKCLPNERITKPVAEMYNLKTLLATGGWHKARTLASKVLDGYGVTTHLAQKLCHASQVSEKGFGDFIRHSAFEVLLPRKTHLAHLFASYFLAPNGGPPAAMRVMGPLLQRWRKPTFPIRRMHKKPALAAADVPRLWALPCAMESYYTLIYFEPTRLGREDLYSKFESTLYRCQFDPTFIVQTKAAAQVGLQRQRAHTLEGSDPLPFADISRL